MQFTSAFLVTSFLALITGVHSASLAFYLQPAQGCTRNDPGNYFISNIQCNVCVVPGSALNPVGAWQSVHGIDLDRGQRLDIHGDTRCSPSSYIVSAQENQGESWTTAPPPSPHGQIRSVFVNCPGQQRNKTSGDVKVVYG